MKWGFVLSILYILIKTIHTSEIKSRINFISFMNTINLIISIILHKVFLSFRSIARR